MIKALTGLVVGLALFANPGQGFAGGVHFGVAGRDELVRRGFVHPGFDRRFFSHGFERHGVIFAPYPYYPNAVFPVFPPYAYYVAPP
jgi:hypothetical protein